MWISPSLNTWSTSFQYIYKWSMSLDYKNRPVKFCWWQYYNRSWKNYWKPYFNSWNRKLSHYWMVQIKLDDCQSWEISGQLKNAKVKDSYPLNINDRTISSENSVKFLAIETDNKLSFEQHISTLCYKASNQLNAIERVQKFMGFKERSS